MTNDTPAYQRSIASEMMSLVDAYADTAAVNGIHSSWAQMARASIDGALIQRLESTQATPAHPAEGVPAPATVVDALQSLIEAIQFTPLGVRQIHAMERAREALAATHPTHQGLDAQIPEGMQLAPIVPSLEWCVEFMCVALRNAEFKRGYDVTSDDVALGYHYAMKKLAAQAKQGGV